MEKLRVIVIGKNRYMVKDLPIKEIINNKDGYIVEFKDGTKEIVNKKDKI